MTEHLERVARPEPRDVRELKQLKLSQPELATAVDMQLALMGMHKRVQSRVPLPWIQTDPDWVRGQLAAGRPVVRFQDIPLDWTDFRLTFRQTADILRRFEVLDQAEHETIVALGRDSNVLEPLVTQWYEATSGVESGDAQVMSPNATPTLEQVLVLALRPFLARCAEVLAKHDGVSAAARGRCPYCGWEPDFAVITPAAERRLICGRCTAEWPFDPLACPFCANGDRSRITSFATRDGRYRVYACDVCRRYLKAFDGRQTERPVMIAVDAIATLPLDAAAMQRGYIG